MTERMDWVEFKQGDEIEPGYYLVYHERYYWDWIKAVYDGKSFTFGPQNYLFPSTIPLEITHYLRIPDNN